MYCIRMYTNTHSPLTFDNFLSGNVFLLSGILHDFIIISAYSFFHIQFLLNVQKSTIDEVYKHCINLASFISNCLELYIKDSKVSS